MWTSQKENLAKTLSTQYANLSGANVEIFMLILI